MRRRQVMRGKKMGRKSSAREKKVLKHLEVWTSKKEREDEGKGEEGVGDLFDVRRVAMTDVDVAGSHGLQKVAPILTLEVSIL